MGLYGSMRRISVVKIGYRRNWEIPTCSVCGKEADYGNKCRSCVNKDYREKRKLLSTTNGL